MSPPATPADPVPSAPGLAALVQTWVEGWMVCRSGVWSPVPEVPDTWRVEGFRTRNRAVEVVTTDPSPEALADLAAAHLDPTTWLSLLTPEPWRGPVPDRARVLADDEALMTCVLEEPVAREGEPVLLAVDGARAEAVAQVDGEPVAQGTVGVVGSTAVFDWVRTEDAYRRRGLGSRVMAGLTTWAVQHGATTGLLAASPEGQALYTRLGWHHVASLATLDLAPDAA